MEHESEMCENLLSCAGRVIVAALRGQDVLPILEDFVQLALEMRRYGRKVSEGDTPEHLDRLDQGDLVQHRDHEPATFHVEQKTPAEKAKFLAQKALEKGRTYAVRTRTRRRGRR